MHEAPEEYNDFQKRGHIGKVSGVTAVNNATRSFTGAY